MAKRKRYTQEFKQEAVRLARSRGESVSAVARDLGLNPNMLSRWCRELEADGAKAFGGQGNARDEELARLRRELAQVKQERDFLKDAAAYFAKESK
jgi:transposase